LDSSTRNYHLPWSWAISFSIFNCSGHWRFIFDNTSSLARFDWYKYFYHRWISQAGFIFQNTHKSFRWIFSSPYSVIIIFTISHTFWLLAFWSYEECTTRA
jgi:hypothetical protein